MPVSLQSTTIKYKDSNGTYQNISGFTGEGVPSGGTTGQVLTKASNNNFDTQWANAILAPANPSSGQFLVYNGSAWVAMTLSTWQGGSY